MEDPEDVVAVDSVKRLTNLNPDILVSGPSLLEKALDKVYGEIQKTADFLKALGEFNRLSLVYNLCRCESSQNAMCLCDCCSVDASVVSRHLKVLAERDIVTFDKVGREKTYRLNRNEVATQLRELADLIENSYCKRGNYDV